MSLLSMLRRILVFTLVGAIPFAAIGFSAGHLRGVMIAEGVFLLLTVFAALRSERALLKVYRVRSEMPVGVKRSLDRVLARLGGPVPRVFSFSDPAPQALVIRSWGSDGSILLSEGLLGSLSEEDLRGLLKISVLRLRSRGIRFQSLCAWLAHQTLALAPRSWVELLFGELRWHENLGAFGALRFLLVYSVAKFFVGLGRTTVVDAMRTMPRLPNAAGEVANPGSCILHFSDPWASRSLFPL